MEEAKEELEEKGKGVIGGKEKRKREVKGKKMRKIGRIGADHTVQC